MAVGAAAPRPSKSAPQAFFFGGSDVAPKNAISIKDELFGIIFQPFSQRSGIGIASACGIGIGIGRAGQGSAGQGKGNAVQGVIRNKIRSFSRPTNHI